MSPHWFIAWPAIFDEAAFQRLQDSAPFGLRFFHRDDLHITLAFLGVYQRPLTSKLLQLLQDTPIPTLEITLNSLVALPQEYRFSALAFQLQQGRLELEKQISKWRDRFCRAAGAPLEKHPPDPHLTIARPHRLMEVSDHEAIQTWKHQCSSPSLTVQLQTPQIYVWIQNRKERQFELLGHAEILQ